MMVLVTQVKIWCPVRCAASGLRQSPPILVAMMVSRCAQLVTQQEKPKNNAGKHILGRAPGSETKQEGEEHTLAFKSEQDLFFCWELASICRVGLDQCVAVLHSR